MIANEESSLKVCYQCGTAQPVEHFRYRKRGSPARQGICRRCYNERMRWYRRARRSKNFARFAAQLRQARSLGQVSGLVAGMAARLGGVDGLCRAWVESIRAAKPGSRTTINAFLAIVHILQVVEASRPSNDVSRLSDEELDRELHGLPAGMVV
jgi:hypothetical protein